MRAIARAQEDDAMAVNPIPTTYPRLMPYLAVAGAAEAIAFYKEMFGATERMRMPGPDGKVAHAELQLGESVLMLADEFPEMNHVGPKRLGGSPVTLTVYVENVDQVVARATAKGAKILQPVENKFYGDRAGQIEDPWGHRWSVMTHVEDVTPEEMMRRMKELPG
jgi:PhnB protein